MDLDEILKFLWLFFQIFSTNDDSSLNIPANPTMKCIKKDAGRCLTSLSNIEKQELNKICGLTKVTNGSYSIAYGQLAEFSDSPWTAGLVSPDGQFRCTSVVFSKKHVGISIHCFMKQGKQIFDNALDFKILYGGKCILNSPECVGEIPTTYRHDIRSISYPQDYLSVVNSVYDYAIIEVQKPFNFDEERRPICLLKAENRRVEIEKERFVKKLCDPHFLTQVGFSGDQEKEPQHNAGRLRILSAAFDDNYDLSGDQILVRSIKPENQTQVPTTVDGDSGGPLQCRKQNSQKYILVGNLKRRHNEGAVLIPGKDVITFTPFYQRSYCEQTNACFSENEIDDNKLKKEL